MFTRFLKKNVYYFYKNGESRYDKANKDNRKQGKTNFS